MHCYAVLWSNSHNLSISSNRKIKTKWILKDYQFIGDNLVKLLTTCELVVTKFLESDSFFLADNFYLILYVTFEPSYLWILILLNLGEPLERGDP